MLIAKLRRAGAILGRLAFAGLFILAGVGHFASTDLYTKMVPPYLPSPRALVLVSGGFELALGLLLLVPMTSRLAAWGLIALLIAVFSANIYIYQHQGLVPFPPIVHLIRLPLQAALIFWAYAYTRPAADRP